MKDALKGYLALASGLTEVTRKKATSAAKALVAQGEATAGQVSGLADDLLSQSKSNREALTALVRFEVDKALGRVGLASADEVTELTARVRQLEGQLREATKPAAAATTTRATAAVKRAPGKKAPAKKAPAKKAPAKKAAAKKAPARKAAAAKAPAKKAPSTSSGA